MRAFTRYPCRRKEEWRKMEENIAQMLKETKDIMRNFLLRSEPLFAECNYLCNTCSRSCTSILHSRQAKEQ